MNNPDLLSLEQVRSKPLNNFLFHQEQYRLKVQQYGNCPPEYTVQRVDLSRDADAYQRAWERGLDSVKRGSVRREAKPLEERSEEDLQRSCFRSKSRLRVLVTELAPNNFTTFTTREDGSRPYLTPEDWKLIWAHFQRLVRIAGIDFQYVAVLERHPSNPEHLHLHVAWRGRASYNFLRRLWHIAICAHRGERISKMRRGADAPGNVQNRPIKASSGFKQVRKIARYICKYITKDLIVEFNKRRYWPSKGISPQSAKVFWLESLSMSEALREAMILAGEWDYEKGSPAQCVFNPSERVAWCAVDPGRSPPPF